MTLPQLVDACGWTLIHFVWQGAAAALALGCALSAIPAARVQARYLSACLALLAMIASAIGTFAWQANIAALPSDALSISAASASTRTSIEATSLASGGPIERGAPTLAWADGEAPATSGGATAAAPPAITRNWVAAASAWIATCFDWLVGLWTLGVALLCMRLLMNWRAVSALRSSGRPIEQAVWAEALARLARELGVKRRVRLLQSAQARVPMVIGWLRPVILAPAEIVTGLSLAEIRAIVAHELAHIRRYDYLVNLLQNVAETVLFFHPAVWWASGQIRRERECCCDAAAARVCDGPARYARALLAIETLRGTPALAMAATGGSLLTRVRRLAGQDSRAPLGAGGTIAVLGSIVVAVLLGMGGERAAGSEQADGEEPAADAEDGPLTDAEAKELAVHAHQRAAALDELPQLYYEVSYRNGDVATMGEVDDYSLENLRKAFDEPVEETKWIEHDSTLAWDPRHVIFASHSPSLSNSEGGATEWRGEQFGGRSEGWSREQRDDSPPNFYRRASFEAFWENALPFAFKFLALTPRQFWWGDNYGHKHGHNSVPPAMVDYRDVGREELGGEICDVVESKGRAERLWIGRDSGLIRGCMTYIYQGRMITDFYRHPVVEQVAGRTFASSKEYRDWHEQHGKKLPPKLDAELTKAWYEAYFDEMAKASNLTVFSDYREIAPGAWLPFREDRTLWHHSGPNDETYKYIRCETRVTKASVDVDLAERVKALAPQPGDYVQDLRFDGAVVDYQWRDVSAEEIESLVLAQRLRTEDAHRLLEELAAPMAKLVGQPAPALTDEGWIGRRPELAGKPYLIHFWATWCGPCKNDYEILNRVAKNRAVIGIHPAGTPREKVQEAIDESRLIYPTLLSTKSKDELVGGYPVKMYPYCVVVDEGGNVAAHGRLAEVAEAFGDLHEEEE